MLLSAPAIAQEAHDANIRFKKEDRPGVVAQYDAPESATEDALEQKLKGANLGRKQKESGFWKYEGVTWPEISPNKIDVYFNVERRKGHSEVSMMVSPGNGNFATVATDPQIIEGMKAFLTRFNADVIAWQQQLALAAQQKEVAEAARDLKEANRDKERLERRQKKAAREEEKKAREVDEQQKKLDDLRKTQ